MRLKGFVLICVGLGLCWVGCVIRRGLVDLVLSEIGLIGVFVDIGIWYLFNLPCLIWIDSFSIAANLVFVGLLFLEIVLAGVWLWFTYGMLVWIAFPRVGFRDCLLVFDCLLVKLILRWGLNWWCVCLWIWAELFAG